MLDMLTISEGGRVGAAIARLTAKMAHDPAFADKVASLDETNALTFEEHFEYQQVQASAHASGKLTTGEASLIYQALGEGFTERNGGWAIGVGTATKIVVTMAIGELLGVA